MVDVTTNEGWPLVAAAQAQKHVPVNEALTAADARVNTWIMGNWTFPAVAAGILTVTSSYVAPAPETGTTDDVTNLAGGPADGRAIVVIIQGTAGVTLNFIDGGNLKLGDTSRTLNNFDDILTLVRRGTDWCEMGFSNNG